MIAAILNSTGSASIADDFDNSVFNEHDLALIIYDLASIINGAE